MFCPSCGKKVMKIARFCKHCGFQLRGSKKKIRFFDILLLLLAMSMLVVLIVSIFLAFIYFSADEADTGAVNENINENLNINLNLNLNTTRSIEEISASVVNIWCPFDTEEFNLDSAGYGGSGTILDKEGLVMTNSHVIPQDEKYLLTHEKGCFVILPDSVSGIPDEIYVAEPFVYPGISDEYDIAYMDIYDVYDDGEYVYGEYPRDFPAFDDTEVCSDEYIKLGEKVHVFGYPVSSGSYSLTVTDGIVSSFPGDGTIITSAKIDSGNSGGLAVDASGCMIGIPSAVYLGEHENMGVIISVDLIYEFLELLEGV